MSQAGIVLLVLFTGWTLACHISTLVHASLIQACLLVPLTTAILAVAARWALRQPQLQHALPHNASLPVPTLGIPGLAAALTAILLLHYSWYAFWLISVATLLLMAYSSRDASLCNNNYGTPSKRDETWIAVLSLIAAGLTLTMCRSDLDDAYYVATAAFIASHPHASLLIQDPMFGEPGWPILFPSYRFAAYEPLAAVLAHATGLPAMDVMYKVLPPIAAISVVWAVFFCSRQLFPSRWLLVGSATLLLMVLLGEQHRSAANFGFVRIFQGKAIFLSTLVPVIYGISFRFASYKGRVFDLFLLACAQVASIGLSNFAMLCAPLAGTIAAISVAPPFSRTALRKLVLMLATTCVALPYLAFVALQSRGDKAFAQFELETAPTVWTSVFGPHQQYLVALLFLLAPLTANTAALRWRLAIPPLLLLAVLLNPLTAPFISRYVTSPPVYWRVTWTFPALLYLGASLTLLLDRTRNKKALIPATAAAASFVLIANALPYNIFRSANRVEWRFASNKVEQEDAYVANQAIISTRRGQILANDPIAGIIAMHENHPPLVNVRDFYIDLLAPSMSLGQYQDRKLLARFVSGNTTENDAAVSAALTRQNVQTVVLAVDHSSYDLCQLTLKTAGFASIMHSGIYEIWTRTDH